MTRVNAEELMLRLLLLLLLAPLLWLRRRLAAAHGGTGGLGLLPAGCVCDAAPAAASSKGHEPRRLCRHQRRFLAKVLLVLPLGKGAEVAVLLPFLGAAPMLRRRPASLSSTAPRLTSAMVSPTAREEGPASVGLDHFG